MKPMKLGCTKLGIINNLGVDYSGQYIVQLVLKLKL